MKVHISAMLLIGMLSAPLAMVAQQGDMKPAPAAVPTDQPASAPAASVAPSAVAPVTAAPGVNPDTYVVGPEDSISVNVWKEPTLSGSFPVRPDGMISLALVGDVVAAGRTPMELATELTTKLKKYITDPTVTVTVLGVNSKRIFMLGEIAHIGALPLSSAMTPLQAIAAAGGLSPYANKSHIYILRSEPGGKQKKIPFDYKKAIKDGDMQGVTLLPGDTIVVP